jgi:acyl-CoA hydrolase
MARALPSIRDGATLHRPGLRTDDPDAAARAIIERTGGDIRLALPLGLGKSAAIANALTHAAEDDSAIHLSIFTALTLEPPDASGDMEHRFMEPARARLFGGLPGFRYAELLRADALPPNIDISEFFLMAGRWLKVDAAQRRYVPVNYTDALPLLLERKPNVIAQLVAREGDRLSLSCNPDLTVDLLSARRDGQLDFTFAAEISDGLPFMGGSAAIDSAEAQMLLDRPEGDPLFSLPQRPVSLADQAVGLHVSRLVRDGGTLQIGIGSIGDGVSQALLLRHGQNDSYRRLIETCPFGQDAFAETAPFHEGLHGSSEMLVFGMLPLLENGVIAREAEGALIRAAFFIGSRDMRARLRDMTQKQRDRIAMVSVRETNLPGKAQDDTRRDARFINNAMKVSLLGSVFSDATPDGREVSGVGGQFDFIALAFHLPGARAVTTLESTRKSKGETSSNIIWEAAHETAPRQFRDIVVTEYGIADLRWRTDEDAARAMIGVADSRYQPELLDAAKRAGKLPRDADIPSERRNNTPAALRDWLASARENGALPTFPFGTDFTPVEQRLLPALSHLGNAAASRHGLAALVWRGFVAGQGTSDQRACLRRMELDRPKDLRQRAARAALLGALVATETEAGLPKDLDA